MKKSLVLLISLFLVFAYGCSSEPKSNFSLPPKEFAEKINQLTASPVIDVRTPGEYLDGHLLKATNIDWNSDDFEARISQLDKSQPVFVYCQGGGRSEEAAKQMRSDGFKEVYELNGGFGEWQNAKLPESTNETPK